MAPRSPRITYSGFYKGGRGARSDSKAADWNYDHWMFDLAVRDPGCLLFPPEHGFRPVGRVHHPTPFSHPYRCLGSEII